ncbi:MAG: DinB family protein [Ginsengibacter sp.]
MESKSEVWQRGPSENIPIILQPVAHALLQAREELNFIMKDFPESLLWERRAGVASPAFHLQHLRGVLDRLFTYAKNKSLTHEQLTALSIEGNKENFNGNIGELIDLFNKQVEVSINELRNTNTNELTEVRLVGRKKIPSTLMGLYVHSAEHTMRHIGQLLVTVKVLKAGSL